MEQPVRLEKKRKEKKVASAAVNPSEKVPSNEERVQATNDDSIVSKRMCIQISSA